MFESSLRVALCAALVSSCALSVACGGDVGSGREPEGPDGRADAGTAWTARDGAAATEECNGLDDDADGSVDEGCACAPGETQACWPGDPSLRGVGACTDGVQTCAGSIEFAEWGPCDGAVLACGEGDRGGTGGGGDGSGDGGGDGSGDGDGDGSGTCTSTTTPDMLVVLDRTQSMHRTPGGATPSSPERSKWYLAITAIEAVLPSFEASIRFGLELFPMQARGCVTLPQKLMGTNATNAECQAGEIVVPLGSGTATAIASALDPLATRLCDSTPIGLALGTAGDALRAARSAGRPQHVLLITDGKETCESRPIETAQALAREGVRTHVVAFEGSGDLDGRRLNNMACAGRTARSFETSCVDAGGGDHVARAPDGARLFHLVTDEVALEASLREIASSVRCR